MRKNIQTSKIQQEWEVLNAVKTIYADFPNGEIRKSEEPDFLLTSSNETIGFEVTEYHHGYEEAGGDKSRRSENIWLETIRQVETILRQKLSSLDLLVSVRRSDRAKPIPYDQIDDIASRIAGLIIANEDDAAKELTFSSDALQKYGLENELREVTIYREKQDLILFPIDDFSILSPIDHPNIPKVLEKIIRKKETKLPSYLHKCNKVWLVIYTGFPPSSRIDTTFGMDEYRIPSAFAEVLLVDMSDRVVFSLKLP